MGLSPNCYIALKIAFGSCRASFMPKIQPIQIFIGTVSFDVFGGLRQ